MESIFLIIVVFLVVLAVFDLFVGVSNDAVNFINSAVGSKAASFKTILAVSAVGVFAGAALSNGMMDVARHGIFTPEYYSFYDVICIFLAVMITDVILLDVFNTLGLPTSTTVSMVFEMLGGAFSVAAIKVLRSSEMEFSQIATLLNTDKAIGVIIAIFVSVAIAFVFGTFVMWVTRLIFSFAYHEKRAGNTVKLVSFGAVAATCILYFLLVKGLKGSTLMTPELKDFVSSNTFLIITGLFGASAVTMLILSILKINVLKVVVLMGTFALAMAFAGNDLVNFVGVPLTGLDAFLDYQANGNGDPDAFMMVSLQGSANTPMIFLMSAGLVMVLSLIFSKKSHNVTKTEVGLGTQDNSNEMFGSSAIARGIVRSATKLSLAIDKIMPEKLAGWMDKRFNVYESKMENGAAFDLLRASVNLVFAGLLIALGTSLKLPLSTTYVTFMVAMGSSLADRAWARERAVFRITGVFSVIGGWFVTAVAAFLLCGIIVMAAWFGGYVAMIVMILVAIFVIVRSNVKYKKEEIEENGDILMAIQNSGNLKNNWKLLCAHVVNSNVEHFNFVADEYRKITDAFFAQQYRVLKNTGNILENQRIIYKQNRRREIVAMRYVDHILALERNTWFFLSNNSCQRMLFCLKNINEPCREHVGNSLLPVPSKYIGKFLTLRNKVSQSFEAAVDILNNLDANQVDVFRKDAQNLQDSLSLYRKDIIDNLQDKESNIETMTLFVNMIQESQELVASLRHAMRGMVKFVE